MTMTRKTSLLGTLVAGITAGGLLAPASAQANLGFTRLDAFSGSAGNGEIIGYSSLDHTVASTFGATGVELLTLSASGQLSSRGVIDASAVFSGIGDTLASASSVALDPLGRGLGVVSLIPTMNGTNTGKLGLFDFRAGSFGQLNVLDVGFHPDSVSFAADGSRIFVANEGEFTTGGASDAPGSLSVVDLSSVGFGTFSADIAALTNTAVKTYDFSAPNLAAGIDLSALRYNDISAGAMANPERHIEPEYVTSRGNEVFVTLQENSGLAVFDLTSEKWERVMALSAITQVIDASDRDTGIEINDVVKGTPMPDAIAVYESGGKTYAVTANEGDFRIDDADRIRIKDIDRADIDDSTEAALDAIYGNFQDDGALGRLRVSLFDGDTDGDGDFDEFIMPGTRSLSIWDTATGTLVGDTGSLENVLALLDPAKHNIDDGLLSEFDARSDDKGPEPESVTLAEIDGRVIAFVGLERQNGVLALDITDPTNITVDDITDPAFAGYFNDLGEFAFYAPESIFYIAGSDSPTGGNLLLAGFENAGGGIAVYSATVVPVPAAVWMMLSGLGVVAARRRKA